MKLAACSILLALAMPVAAGAVTVNLDGKANASLDGSNGVTINLAPGQYVISPVQGAYTAFNRFGAVLGCNGAGESCSNGWEWGFEASADQTVTGPADCCGDNNGQGGDYRATADQALAHALAAYASLGPFTISTPTNVTFWLSDDYINDNIGGVSFNLQSVTQAVPEPASWAMMLLGFFGLGACLRRKGRVAFA
jgi:hypothetical protein